MKERKQKTLGKRLLVAMLSVMMTVTFIPTSLFAYAAEPEVAPDDVQNDVQTEVVQDEPTEATEAVQKDEPQTEATEATKAKTTKEDTTNDEDASDDEIASEEDADADSEFSGGDLKQESDLYKITVSYDADAMIPKDAELFITEFSQKDKEYKDAKQALVDDEDGNSVFSQTTKEEQEDLGMAAFDLTIRDKDGNVVEPESKVSVSVEFKELPEGVAAEDLAASMEIQHLNESTGDIVVEKVATVDSKEATKDKDLGEINVKEKKETAETDFNVDVFSTFTITWRTGYNARTVTVHYVDENGNELTIANPDNTHPDMNANSSSPAFLIYDIDGYEYSYTYRNTDTNANRIAPILSKNNNNYWRYTGTNNVNWTEMSNNDDIYVVYKKKADPTTGGTPVIDDAQESDWPQGSATPQFGKSSTNNGNGTNTVSLSISGGEAPYERSTKANVIVVFDRSGSMGGDNIWRLNTAKNAVKNMAETLLDGDITGVKMALVSFSTTASTVQEFTDDYDTYEDAVDGLTASGGTNWEQALSVANRMAVDSDAATYVVFVTDGDPTFRVSRGDVDNNALRTETYNSNTTYQYYRNNHVYGEGNNDSANRNFDYAAEEVKSILDSNKTFYAIGVSADVTKVQNLVDEAGGGTAYLATDSAALEEAFANITQSIKTNLGFGDVEITDGITALTNAEMKVMQTVDPNSFKYYRYGGENNKYGADYAHKTEWTTRAADGCAAATYSETDGAVHWDMGETFQLENDVTYVVEFTVWPSQAAYDLVADLNNGLRTYASLTDAEKAQVVEVTPPTATTTGTYALKTNTDQVNATYNKTTKTGDTVTISDTTDIDANYTEGTLQNMSLDSDDITVKKEWHNALDPRVETGITLTVTKDGSAYLDNVSLNNGNNWTSGKEYISTGFITKTSDGRYNVREKGHEYTVTEPASFSYYWDLTADVYRPMVINGTLTMLIKTDNPTGTEGTDYYVIDGKSYQVSETTHPQLVAKNDRRSNLNLSKNVETNPNPNPNATFTYTITVTDINGDAVWFGAQDKDGNTVPIENYSSNVTPQVDASGNPTGSYSVPSGAQFTISIKDGWNVRFFNLPTGTTYSIQETAMSTGYGFVKAETSTEVTDPDYAADYQATPGTVRGDTVTGTIDQPNNVFSVAYTNKVTAATAEPEVTKQLSGRDWTASDSFQFKLEPVTENAPMPAGTIDDEKTVTADSNNKTVGFGTIMFSEEGEYEYTITEIKPQNPIAGVVYDETPHTVKITVSKDANGDLVAAVKYDGDQNSLTVTNTLTPVTAAPQVTKTLNGREFKDDDSFTFTIVGEDDNTPMPAQTTATANKASNWIAAFGNISYNSVGTYKYTITETKGSADGVTYNTTPINVVVTVSTDADNKLVTSIKYDGEASASVENTFTPVTQDLEVTKILSGRDWEDADSFTFTLAAGESQNAADETITTPMPAEAGRTATATKDDPQTEVNENIAKFGTITFNEAGTYRYTITEEQGDLDGVAYDTTPKNVVVTVSKDSATNALSVTSVKYEEKDALSVTNTFVPSTEVPIQVTKALTGRDWNNTDSFEFTLTAGSAPAGVTAPMPANTTATATKANPIASFGTVKFNKAGTYTYIIKETKGTADGITYDTSEHVLTVVVTKGAGNVLTTSWSYDGGEDLEGLTVTNRFSPTSAQIEATKVFDSWGKANSFTFKLAAKTAGAPMPAGLAEDGTKTVQVTESSKTAVFGTIEFTEAKDYTYTVTEVNDGVDGVTYDTTPHEVTVHVVKDTDTNELTATVDYGSAEKLEIENTFTPVQESIEVTKDFGKNDWAKAGAGFRFELKAGTNTAGVTTPMPAGSSEGSKIGTATEANKTVDFGDITFEKAGTYNYTITEQNDGADGVTYDTTPHNVVVTVTKGDDNALTATVKYDGENSLTVENTFEPVTVPIDVTKNFTGRDWTNSDKFIFKLEPVSDDAPMPPASGLTEALGDLLTEGDSRTVEITKDTPDYTDTFGTITFEKADTYTYKITEVRGSADGVAYDTSTHTVVVTVSKDPDTNALTAEVTYDGEASASLTVDNTFTPAEAPIQVTKQINDWGQTDSFTFTLEAKGGAPMPASAEGNTMTAKATEVAPTAVFGTIKYPAAGDYRYTITEKDDGVDGVTYDTSEHTVVVHVDKNANTNALTATVTYDTDQEELIITNRFASSKTSLQATKSFADWGKADSFEFTLAPVDGAPMPAGATDNKVVMEVTEDNPTAIFGEIEYKKAGTYSYTITETAGTADGVTYDTTPHNVVVTVSKGEGNALTAEVKYDNADSLTITNTYKPVKKELEATKSFSDWGKAESFTFELAPGESQDAEGETIDTPMPADASGGKVSKTVTADNLKALFGEIEFEKAGIYKYTITEVNDHVDGVTYDTTPHEVVVTVTKGDAPKNELSAAIEYDGKTSLTITNSYSESNGVKLEATKDFEDWGKADNFTFDLAAVTEGAPLPTNTVATATSTNGKKAVFDEIKFGKAGDYIYTITERDGGVPGVTYDTMPHTVTVHVVKDPETNALTATPEYETENGLTVTNTFTPVTTHAEVTKAFEDWGKADSFTFDLAAVTEGAPMPAEAGRSATATQASPTAVFGDISFDTVGKYEYTITERNGGADGVSYDTTPKKVTIVISPTSDTDNTLKATVTYGEDNADSLIVTNTYSKSNDVELKATKSFNDWGKAESFTFTLADAGNDIEGVDTNPMPANTRVTATEENKTAIFGKVQFEKAGEYKYTITEIDDHEDGVTYDTTPKTVVVTVTKAEDATNALTATVKYEDADELTIVNNYKSTKATLQATKAFNDWGKAESFTFDLAGVEKDGKLPPMPSTTEATATKGSPVAAFPEITFEKAGVYEYTITERNDGADGVSYDTTPHKAVVTVAKKSETDNTLVATVKYDDTEDSLIVTNTYTAVKKGIEVTKNFNDWGKADSFTFTLEAQGNAPMPEGVTGTTKTAMATKDAPTAEFGDITFEKAGEYKYTITETDDHADGVTYDTKSYEVVVTVSKDPDTNKLTAAVKYDGDKDKLTVTNTYKPLVAEDLIKATKEFNDWGKADSFTFKLEAVSNTAGLETTPMPASDTVKATKDKKTAVFGTITYEKSGEYKYTITEINDHVDGVTYDETPHEVIVTVAKKSDTDNTLVATVTYDGEESLTIENTYTPLVTEDLLQVTKELSGRDWLDADEFEFTLEGVDGAPMPKGSIIDTILGKETRTAKATKANQTAVFGEITFEKAGTYKYTITEVDGGKGGITYDMNTYEVTVVISKDPDTNALEVESVTYDEDKEALTVTNTYRAVGSAEFDAQKTLRGRDLAEGEFEFELKLDGTTVGGTEANDADGKVTFDAIQFVKETGKDQTGDHTVTISEVVPADDADKLGGVTYDTTVATIPVTVTDNGDGTLDIKYDGKDKAPTPEFINDYEARGELVLDGLKTLEYGDLAEQSFDFVILDGDGSEVATATAGGEGADVEGDADTKAGTSSEFTFSTIEYVKKYDAESEKTIDETGDYTYTIKEVIPDDAVNTKTGKTYKEDPAADGIFELGNYRYDNSVKTVKVTVEDNGDGTLQVTKDPAEVEYDAEFTNTRAYTDITITKELENFVQHDGVNDVTLAFRVVDKETKGKKFSAAGGIKFSAAEVEAGKVKTVTISRIPTDIPVEVTEVYASNFTTDEPTVTLKLEDGVYKASFKNVYDNLNYNSGEINNYTKNDTGGYDFSGKGEQKAGTEKRAGTEKSPGDNAVD
ncbi:MAG: VWA domain-containing protein [Firmicutes bacterium]|nr:VWA domain-containing protein [Bacillota bacterium]